MLESVKYENRQDFSTFVFLFPQKVFTAEMHAYVYTFRFGAYKHCWSVDTRLKFAAI